MLFLALATAMAQIPRQMVVLEITTCTWCYYCPGAALGAEDLLANGKHVAVVEHHNNAQGNDPFTNSYSLARCTHLGYGGSNPYAFFDIRKTYNGGDHNNSVYNAYLPLYNVRIAKGSPVRITIDMTNSGLNYTANVTIEKVATINQCEMRMYCIVTQSNINHNWEGQTQLHYVNRLMLPDANGTLVDFTASNTVTFPISFTLNSSWPTGDCEFIAFLEDVTNKEILNGMKRALVDLQVAFSTNDTNVLINQPVSFTNETTGGYIHAMETYKWLFPGGTPSTSTLAEPTVMYADSGRHDVSLIVDRGGQIDTLKKTALIKSSYPVGIQQAQPLAKVTVAPNPTHGVFMLEVWYGKEAIADISVISAVGMTVYSEKGVSFANHVARQIDLGQVARGVYFVIVETNGSKIVRKIIVD
jgi:PKD repeat protein